MNLTATAVGPDAALSGPQPIAESAAMREVLAAVRDVAPTHTTVLLLGESGTGKEVLARLIHCRSARALGPFVSINCAAPGHEIEADLFGAQPEGTLAPAQAGTLLLDEIGELPGGLQARLVRSLQERSVERGASSPRIIAASGRDLAALVRGGQFRADLYYRLNVFPIRLPPLRERTEDVAGLAAQLIHEAATRLGLPAPRLTNAAVESLKAERFPGNVRELANLLERALVRCRASLLDARDLGLDSPAVPLAAPSPTALAYPPGLPLDLTALERLAIEEALRRVSGNRTHAARLLGIGLRTLRNKLRLWREAGLPVLPSSEPGEKAA